LEHIEAELHDKTLPPVAVACACYYILTSTANLSERYYRATAAWEPPAPAWRLRATDEHSRGKDSRHGIWHVYGGWRQLIGI
jgi:hypothetical protein